MSACRWGVNECSIEQDAPRVEFQSLDFRCPARDADHAGCGSNTAMPPMPPEMLGW